MYRVYSLIGLFSNSLESFEWILAAEIQEQQRMAEALGRLHGLLSIFLQVLSGQCKIFSPLRI